MKHYSKSTLFPIREAIGNVRRTVSFDAAKDTQAIRPRFSTELAAFARNITKARQLRKNALPATLFGEPGWDMLLSLYCASADDRRMTVSHMCEASQVPDTTALRWIEQLCQLGLIQRRPNPLDARVVFLEIESATVAMVEDYLVQARSLLNQSPADVASRHCGIMGH